MVTSKTKQVEEEIDSLLAQQQVELILYEYKKQGQSWTLRLFIDHPDGVSLELCSEVSRQVSEYLDAEDPFEHEYHLEVSSPGIERPLVKPEHFEKYVGERVMLQLFKPLTGIKKLTGILMDFSVIDSSFECTVENEGDSKIYKVPLDQISKATLKPILDF